MIKLYFAIACFFVLGAAAGHSYQDTTSIYSYQIRTASDSVINLSSWSDKKILFVNTATNSPNAGQFAALEQLYQQYKDSLVIVAIPSNDFGNEPSTDSTMQTVIGNSYNIHFIVASKTSVSGDNQCPLYQWLTHSSLNGVVDNPVGNDFFKFLIDRSGHLAGVYSNIVDPMSDEMTNALNN